LLKTNVYNGLLFELVNDFFVKKIFIFPILLLLTVNLTNLSFAEPYDKLAVLHTPQGKIVIEFFPNDAPKHVENFIKLTESGFYDNTVFHRIIPGFMIQGGDPNTRPDGTDQTQWGIGGPDYSINAEFNTIKHNRGIVSMARASDPNSAGSQFFIVHKDSNFLDAQYTVFGRIATQESFDTLDKIASVETKSRDIPVNPDEVRITKAEIVNRSDVPDLLPLGEPERTTDTSTVPDTPTAYKSEKLGISFIPPTGWLMQEPDKSQPGAPDVIAVGPKSGTIPPVISLTVIDGKGRTIDEKINELNDFLKPSIEKGELQIINQEKKSINGKDAYVIDAKGKYQANNSTLNVRFSEIIVAANDKFYSFDYSNDENFYDSQLSKFQDTISSFALLEPKTTVTEPKSTTETSTDTEKKGGGCLIATATYGSELAPQVQQLRELRDNQLLQTASGSAFMTGFNQFYYSFSPTVADWERENPAFKELVKITLTPMLSSLSLLNNADMNSDSSVLAYGLSLIMLNVGMYFVAPALVIHTIRKHK